MRAVLPLMLMMVIISSAGRAAVLTARDLRMTFVGEDEAFIGVIQDTAQPLTFRAGEPAITFTLEVRVDDESRLLQPESAHCTLQRQRDRLTHTYRFEDTGVIVVTQATPDPAMYMKAMRYRHEDGRVGVCLVNCDDAPHAVSVEFPADVQMVHAIASRDAETHPIALTDGILTVEVPAATPMLYVTAPAA